MRKTGAKPHSFALFDTSIGCCAIVWNESGVKAIQYPEKTKAETRRRLSNRFGNELKETNPSAKIRKAIEAIVAHLEGKPQLFDSVVLDLTGLPPFHQKVYAAARKIPSGATVSYGQLA